MNELNLSKRLQTVAKYIVKDSIFADIGSDHAYLPCYAILNGLAKGAVAGEITNGPYQSAMNQVKKNQLEEKIVVRKGDGLEVINPGEAQCITIAGMGGSLIAKILEEGKDKLNSAKRLILQPNIHAVHIRKWLLANGWRLIEEEILEEDQKLYEVLVAEKGNPNEPYEGINLEAGLLMGPILLKKKNEVFKKKWHNEAEHWEKIIEKLSLNSDNPENKTKRKELENLLALVKGGLCHE
ncbi:tRNA (adenine(22)-N(1))-methyltransferase [Metabacillus arenae]|uniref:tRNA (Adenine(22)-N(1))-methyltransferase TrmK n=1 Tax=Metabacillus arenae TaxID=2771434 RepID=A0A926NQD9_9BACI|nr:tRNA (adenine(22)-N(1))-methyltransferase TrmK [Metabacillus arenae]MBD1382122.1 tRNA (adenine(22)-N(1))-methyltransferase TrmK [Metabacillus arenae]